MSNKGKKSQVAYPRAVPNYQPQGVFHPNYDGGFFGTEPRIAYGNGGVARSNSNIAHHYVPPMDNSPKAQAAYPMNASFVDRPGHNIYTGAVPKGYVSGYISPPARLDDGLFKKLYTGMAKDSPTVARKTDVEKDLEKHRASQNKFAKRDYSVPVYSNRLPEASIFDDPKFVNYLNQQDGQKSTSLASSPTLKKSALRKTPEHRVFREYQQTSSLPQGLPQHPQSVRNSNAPRNLMDNIYTSDQVLTSNPVEHFKTEGQQQSPKASGDKYHVANEIISPSYQKSTFGRGTRRWPLMEDTAKMRNPMFQSHDFAEYDKSLLLTKPKFKDTSYNYYDVNPVSSKQYLKQHKVTIAQVDADNHPVNHSFKIDASYGVLPITDNEKKSIESLKQRNAQHFHSTQILRKNLQVEVANNSFNGSLNSLNKSRNNLDLPHLVSERQPNEANKHTTDYYRSYGNSPMLSSVEKEYLKTNARFKVMPLSPQVGKQISPPW